jgi:hypothetical protein
MPLAIATGARIRFQLGGATVGLATRAGVNEEINFQPIEVMDNIEVIEHVAVGYTSGLNASQVRIIGETITSLGYFPRKGQTAADFLRNILIAPDLVAQLEDSQTNIIIARIMGVKLQGRNFTVDARGVVNEDLTFVSRRFLDEAETV